MRKHATPAGREARHERPPPRQRWHVRYRDAAGQRSRTFDRKSDADRFDTDCVAAPNSARSTRSPPTPPSTTTSSTPGRRAHRAPRARNRHASSTRVAYDTHVSPALGAMPAAPRSRPRDRRALAIEPRRPGARARDAAQGALRLSSPASCGPARRDRSAGPPTRSAPCASPRRRRCAPRSGRSRPSPSRPSVPACEPRDAIPASVLAYSGIRPQEARALRWAQVLKRTWSSAPRRPAGAPRGPCGCSSRSAR